MQLFQSLAVPPFNLLYQCFFRKHLPILHKDKHRISRWLPDFLINFFSEEEGRQGDGRWAMGEARLGDRARGDKAKGEGRWEEFEILELMRYNLRSTLWDLVFGIWSLEFGSWNLDLGIWNLDLGTLWMLTPPSAPIPSDTRLPGEKYSQGDQPAATDAG